MRTPVGRNGNEIGNATSTMAVARRVGAVGKVRLAQALDGKSDPEDLHARYEVPATPQADTDMEADVVKMHPVPTPRIAA
jgi:hypothetical protein